MELLYNPENRGYPVEYLISRIRGRRVFLINDWETLVLSDSPREYLASSRFGGTMTDKSPEGGWRELMREFRWVYLLMDQGLRRIFLPFFFYSELRTLFTCLRHKRAKEETSIEEVLVDGLLPERARKALKESETLLAAIKGIENSYGYLLASFRGIGEIFVKDGLRGVEQRVTDRYLEETVSSGLSYKSELHPVIRKFFMRIIDSRNVITLLKHMKWDMKAVPDFIKGGNISPSRLREAIEKRDAAGMSSIILRVTGTSVQKPEAVAVENSLYKAMTRFLRREGREPSGIGFVLDYLWMCSIEVRNLGTLLYGKDIDRDVIRAEMAQ